MRRERGRTCAPTSSRTLLRAFHPRVLVWSLVRLAARNREGRVFHKFVVQLFAQKSEITARFSLSKSITSSRSGSVPTVLCLTLSYVVDYVDITIWSYRMAGIHRVLCGSRGRSLMFTIARSRILAQHALERDRVVPDLACCCCIAALEAWSGGIPALRLEYRIAAHANEHRVSGTHVRRTRRWMLSAS